MIIDCLRVDIVGNRRATDCGFPMMACGFLTLTSWIFKNYCQYLTLLKKIINVTMHDFCTSVIVSELFDQSCLDKNMFPYKIDRFGAFCIDYYNYTDLLTFISLYSQFKCTNKFFKKLKFFNFLQYMKGVTYLL